ncbi:acyltransferase family protein [Streptomyces filipinensis]|uniref:acyltransferase family protein n=1 Tax=Streptomyces filipinensis TaxID=66887 RepID=UPI0036EA61F5
MPIQHAGEVRHKHRPKLPSLTGLRFHAAAFVFLYHASRPEILGVFQDGAFADGCAHTFRKIGFAGVSFFFILSGFVLAWSARPNDTLRDFYRRRLLKIFPNHVVMWAVALWYFSTTALAHPMVWWPNLLLVHCWIPRPDTVVSLNQPSWSLCSELLFYLLFPLLWRVVRGIPAGRLWMCFALTFAALLATQMSIDAWVSPTPRLPDWPMGQTQAWLGYNFPPLRLFEFVLGMLMARLLAQGHRISWGIAPTLALTAAGYALTLAVPWQYGFNVILAVPLSLLVGAIATADLTGRRTGLRGRWPTLLGEVSFAFYLVHFMVLVAVHDLLRGRTFHPAAGLAVIALAFVAAQLLSWLLYACVERPVMRRWAGGARSGGHDPAPTRPQLVDQQL